MGHMKKTIKECAGTLWGNLLLAFTVAAFVLPYKVIMGGATGIGIVLSKILPMDTASIILIVNLLALLLGLFALGWRFVASTIASSLLYPFFLGLMQRIPGIDSLTTDPLLAAILAGGIMGISIGLVMRVRSGNAGRIFYRRYRCGQSGTA